MNNAQWTQIIHLVDLSERLKELQGEVEKTRTNLIAQQDYLRGQDTGIDIGEEVIIKHNGQQYRIYRNFFTKSMYDVSKVQK